MALVRVKEKYQVTLPAAVREKAGVAVGDLLEADVKGKKIMLVPGSVIDRELALEEVRKGRTCGPFDSVDELMRSLTRRTKRRRRAIKP
jgi:AbrB family looped-hinge helix DNA binding protein